MIDLNLKNIEYVKGLAKVVAQDTKENQAIYKTVTGRHITYGFGKATIFERGSVAIVRYTPENKRRDILPDNGNGGLDVVDSATDTRKPKSGKSKPKAE